MPGVDHNGNIALPTQKGHGQETSCSYYWNAKNGMAPNKLALFFTEISAQNGYIVQTLYLPFRRVIRYHSFP